MLSFYKKYYKTAIDIGLIALTVYLILLVSSYIYKIAAPIILALLIFYIVEPMAMFFRRRGMKKSIAAGLAMLIFILVIVGALAGAGAIFVMQIVKLESFIPLYAKELQTGFAHTVEQVQQRLGNLPPEFTAKAQEYLGRIAELGSNFVTWLLGKLVKLLTSFSAFIVNLTVAIILAYFLSLEIDFWKRTANEKTPKTFKNAFHFLRENVLKGIGGYIKAQLKLITITFAVIFLALLVLRVENAFAISLLSAFFDLLPLLGVSTVFIPWIVYLFVVGNTTLAISLSVLLGVVIVVRQFMEPKITGDTLGVSAFTMLSFMIISLSLFGVAGLIVSPVLIILLKALYEQGYLKRWIRLPAEEYEEPKLY